jgi:hypothetical protein
MIPSDVGTEKAKSCKKNLQSFSVESDILNIGKSREREVKVNAIFRLHCETALKLAVSTRYIR